MSYHWLIYAVLPKTLKLKFQSSDILVQCVQWVQWLLVLGVHAILHTCHQILAHTLWGHLTGWVLPCILFLPRERWVQSYDYIILYILYINQIISRNLPGAKNMLIGVRTTSWNTYQSNHSSGLWIKEMEGVWVKTSTPTVLVKTGAHPRNLTPLFSSPSLTIFPNLLQDFLLFLTKNTQKSLIKKRRADIKVTA